VVTDHWAERYLERTGSKPTWKKDRHFPNLANLLKQHDQDAAMFCARIDVLFDAPPRFLAGSPPDFDTFLQHFDKLAAPSVAVSALVRQLTTRAGQPALSPSELAAEAVADMAEERRKGLR
jgi:hypothetical protein